MGHQSLLFDTLFALAIAIAISIAITRSARIRTIRRGQAQQSMAFVETARDRRVRWRFIIKRTYSKARTDRILAVAGGVTFYGLLALFPATAALVSVYGLVVDSEYMNELLKKVDGALPTAGVEFLRNRIDHIGTVHDAKLSLALIVSVFLALWGANRGMKALFDGINVSYGLIENRGFSKLNIISMAFTMVLFLFFIIALWAVIAVPFLGEAEENQTMLTILARASRWPALFVLLFVGVSALYRFGASWSTSQPKMITPGALFASGAWIIGSIAVSAFLQNFGEHNWIFGSLAAVDTLLIWMWLSSINILLGAKLNCECER